jgi:uncharacterized protein (TIGR00375 family)
MLTAETSHIYSKKGRVRRVHLLIFAPDFETVDKINAQLSWRGNLKSDGRPIIGMDSKELLKIVLEANPDAMVIPAHAWTPWFSVFGSMSGFDSLEECFDELTPHIHAIETGLSSDPAMNWRISSLDNVAIISNSDSHSPPRIGREANVFDTELSYQGITEAIKEKDPKRFLFTIEFFPEEGKYHFDGHRACGVRLSPEETKKLGGKCPKCGRPVTIGVMARVEELADRPAGFVPEGAIPFRNLVPLDEIIAEAFGSTTMSRKTQEEYHKLTSHFAGELPLLLDAEIADLAEVAAPEVVAGVARVREGRLSIDAGYDGEYGKIRIFNPGEEIVAPRTQAKLF